MRRRVDWQSVRRGHQSSGSRGGKWRRRPEKYGKTVLESNLLMVPANFGLLAINPNKITGDFAELMRRAASEIEALAAGPC